MGILYNLARMTTPTTSTGTITLGAAVGGYLTFLQAGVADGDIVDYAINDGANSEHGFGTYTAAGTTLTRNVTKSTNANALISLTGNAQVAISPRAETLAQMFDYRNFLYANGGFEVWQRGAGGAASIAVAASTTAYTADRWYLATGATEASVVSQQAGNVTNSRFSGRVLRNSGQTGTAVMRFAYPFTTDEVFQMRGQKLMLSLSALTGANWSPTSGTLSVTLYTGTGTEGKRNASAYTGELTPISTTQNIAAGSSAAAFSFLSSALGTNITQAELQFSWTPVGTAGAADYIQFDDVQLEIGPYATTFERVSFREQLLECQRHYAKTFNYATAPAQNAGLTGSMPGSGDGVSGVGNTAWRFPVAMRSSPTVTAYNPSAANSNWTDAVASNTSNTGTEGTNIGRTSAGQAFLHASADAGL